MKNRLPHPKGCKRRRDIPRFHSWFHSFPAGNGAGQPEGIALRAPECTSHGRSRGRFQSVTSPLCGSAGVLLFSFLAHFLLLQYITTARILCQGRRFPKEQAKGPQDLNLRPLLAFLSSGRSCWIPWHSPRRFRRRNGRPAGSAPAPEWGCAHDFLAHR